MALADLFLSLPWMFLLLMVRAWLPLNVSPARLVTITFALLGALGWAAPARVVRAAVRGIKTSDFMLIAQAQGCSPWRLLWRHLIPNVEPVLLAQFWIAVPVYILAETTLGMLGLGIAEPLPSWGGLLREIEGGDVTSRLVAADARLVAGRGHREFAIVAAERRRGGMKKWVLVLAAVAASGGGTALCPACRSEDTRSVSDGGRIARSRSRI